jgi:hypothetical protein
MPLKPGKYFPGSPIRLTVTFADTDGNGVDPTTVKIRTFDPEGYEASYLYNTDANVGRNDTGSYYADITPDKFGLWRTRWETTGTNTTFASEDRFNVQHSPFYDAALRPDYT